MPPHIVYAVMLMLYVGVACAVWLFAALLAISPSMRALARRIASGMLASFPGVIMYQVFGFPLALLYLAISLLVMAFVQPGDKVTTVVAAVGTLGIAAAASLAGFWSGWRAGWKLAAGSSVREVVPTDWLIGPVAVWVSQALRWPNPPLERPQSLKRGNR